jgi:hypothetical protein
MSFHWGGGYVETKEHGTLPSVTEEVLWKMVNAVERGPGEKIRVCFGDYGAAFCTEGGMSWLSKAMMLQLRHLGIYVLSLFHQACQPYFPVAMSILFDTYWIFKPTMYSAKELRHIIELPHGLDTTKGGPFHTVRKFAIRSVDGSPASDKNALIFTKKDGLEYFAWRNTAGGIISYQVNALRLLRQSR